MNKEPTYPPPTPLTKEEAQAYRARWQLVNEREELELRTTPIDVKWQQFLTMLRWAQDLGWFADRDEEVAEVRARWARLRKLENG